MKENKFSNERDKTNKWIFNQEMRRRERERKGERERERTCWMRRGTLAVSSSLSFDRAIRWWNCEINRSLWKNTKSEKKSNVTLFLFLWGSPHSLFSFSSKGCIPSSPERTGSSHNSTGNLVNWLFDNFTVRKSFKERNSKGSSESALSLRSKVVISVGKKWWKYEFSKENWQQREREREIFLPGKMSDGWRALNILPARTTGIFFPLCASWYSYHTHHTLLANKK